MSAKVVTHVVAKLPLELVETRHVYDDSRKDDVAKRATLDYRVDRTEGIMASA